MRLLLLIFYCIILGISNSFASTSTQHNIPVATAIHETAPIPMGIESTDDTAVWLHPTTPGKSRIVGVSKNKIKNGGMSGIALYNLQGEELQYMKYDRLNNVDLKYDIPYLKGTIDLLAASNRDKKSISLFKITEDKLEVLADLEMTDMTGNILTEEPYGFCLSFSPSDKRKLYAFSPMKNGLIYQHIISENNGVFSADPVRIIDTSDYLSRELDQHLINITIKEVIYDKDLSKDELAAELNEEISDRFQLEGCVVDEESETLYYGMENLGVFKISSSPLSPVPAKLVTKVLRAKYEPGEIEFADGMPRIANDIEGMSLHYGPDGQGALIVSIQGLNEYALFDRKSDNYLGSFKLKLTENDPITETDGLEVLSSYMGEDYPLGILVVHDHHNTNERGELENANYKIVSLIDIFSYFPHLKYDNYNYNPRK